MPVSGTDGMAGGDSTSPGKDSCAGETGDKRFRPVEHDGPVIGCEHCPGDRQGWDSGDAAIAAGAGVRDSARARRAGRRFHAPALQRRGSGQGPGRRPRPGQQHRQAELRRQCQHQKKGARACETNTNVNPSVTSATCTVLTPPISYAVGRLRYDAPSGLTLDAVPPMALFQQAAGATKPEKLLTTRELTNAFRRI